MNARPARPSGPTGAAGPEYKDASLPVARRVEDLLSRMTLEEKAGQLFHAMLMMNADGTPVTETDGSMLPLSTPELVEDRFLTHFNLLGSHGAREMARWQNAVQEMAAGTRLGIPVTLSTDPRHTFTDNPGASFNAGAFSAWPEALGLAAIGDPELVHRFADTVRREYLAVGFRVALHPQIDLASEPRWARQSGTFGSDARLTSELVRAYVRGLQGPSLGPGSVSAMVKHFPGGGPQKDGEDPHFAHGKEQVYPGGMREHHLEPFKAAIAAGCAQMMPYYGQPVGTDWEEVGFGFNKGVVTGLLREELGFDGIVCTDWGLINDATIFGQKHPARAWGLEHLSPAERAARALEAGCDQFGGEQCPEVVVELVRSGRVPQSRIDASVRRLLREKFTLGLFENPYVDPDAAEETVGRSDFTALGAAAQRRSLTVLTNPGACSRSPPGRSCTCGAWTRRWPPRTARSSPTRPTPTWPSCGCGPRTSRGRTCSSRTSTPAPWPSPRRSWARSWPSWTASPPWSASTWSGRPSSRRSPNARRRWSPTTERRTPRYSTWPSAGPPPRGACPSSSRVRWRRSRHPVPMCRTTLTTRSSPTATDWPCRPPPRGIRRGRSRWGT